MDKVVPTAENAQGVFGCVVTDDTYGIRRVRQSINTVFDIGANVGCFALLCRVLFPTAHIVSVEPNTENYLALTRQCTLWPNVDCIAAALGRGDRVYHRMGHGSAHSHHGYMTPSLHYPSPLLDQTYEMVDIPTITPGTLAAKYGCDNLLVKIDVEGAEDCLVDDDASNEVLSRANYVCMELHFWSPNMSVRNCKTRLLNWIDRFQDTHAIDRRLQENGGPIWMTRR